jgi:site-specific recombinase XerD
METKPLFPPPPADGGPNEGGEPSADALERAAERYAEQARADGTLARYREHWAAFTAWCERQGLGALPAEPKTIAMYLAARADQGIRPTTLSVTLSAIAGEHRRAKLPPPTKDPLVEETWEGIRRQLGGVQKQKAPLSAAELRRMMDELPAGLIGLRDRALLLLGFAGAMRRAELVALHCGALKFVPEGLEVLVERSKTDQKRKGKLKMVAYGSDPATCPVRAVKDWLELSGLTEGPVFRPINRHEHIAMQALTGHAVARIVKRTALKAGLPIPELSGHSLRAGFVTEAAKNGADYPSIMDQTGHKELSTVHGYNRRKDKWKKPASSKLGL